MATRTASKLPDGWRKMSPEQRAEVRAANIKASQKRINALSDIRAINRKPIGFSFLR